MFTLLQSTYPHVPVVPINVTFLVFTAEKNLKVGWFPDF
ncbi:hypothetical protein PEPS_47770 (plasmid) [Persicobacter psychrovividus]|uniref:Uncharacterized protein n=1 Tax=Persicobacter psychrovividus TaxID=387638 RepID=A0ABM7VNE0_9BACT|nr:hypothetical protein PEPS_47770 [Persicobacter psychrovividus]